MSSNFDKIAPFYGFLEGVLFGSRMQRMRCAHLDHMSGRREILLVGEGTGLFLERLLEVNAQAKVTVVEQSEQMMKRAKRRVAEKDLSRVTFRKLSFEKFDSSKRFDAVCTLFFWDCFTQGQIRSMLPLLERHSKRGALWLDVDFFENPHGSTRTGIWHYLLIRFLYGFFGLATGIEARRIVNIEPLAKENGFYPTATTRSDQFPMSARIFKKENPASMAVVSHRNDSQLRVIRNSRNSISQSEPDVQSKIPYS
tara:strand:+ start:1001 stop:1762 length:762 start_codon:yes stop_codon:yes gene_type:complete